MRAGFEIDASWEAGSHGSPENRKTLARIRIVCGDRVATRSVDTWSHSEREDVVLAAYPLALWLASNWWRLRWEPCLARPSLDWRLSHDLAAAGNGYLWPRITLESEGELIHVHSEPTRASATEPIAYLERLDARVDGLVFERAVDEFLNATLGRLEASCLSATDLHRLWEAVTQERLNEQDREYRRFEAMLGFDPDEAPGSAMKAILELADRAGRSAVGEIAPLRVGADPERMVQELHEREREDAPQASIPLRAVAPGIDPHAPWETGRRLARLTRETLGLEPDAPLKDATLEDALGLEAGVLARRPSRRTHQSLQLGLGVRTDDGQVQLHLQKHNPSGRRFETARLLADALTASPDDRWLPAVDTGTARQRMQRAFAAEFLCPFQALEAHLEGDYSDDAVEEAGTYFGVSSLAVRSHLAFHGRVPQFEFSASGG